MELFNISLIVFIYLLVVAYGTYYTVYAVLRTDGPFELFLKLRLRVGSELEFDLPQYIEVNGVECTITTTEGVHKYELDDKLESYTVSGDTFFSKVLNCEVCAAPYAALFVALLTALLPPAGIVLAAAGFAVEKFTK